MALKQFCDESLHRKSLNAKTEVHHQTRNIFEVIMTNIIYFLIIFVVYHQI